MEKNELKKDVEKAIRQIDRSNYVLREDIMRTILQIDDLRRAAIKILGKHYKKELKDTLELYEAKTLTDEEHLKNMETL